MTYLNPRTIGIGSSMATVSIAVTLLAEWNDTQSTFVLAAARRSHMTARSQQANEFHDRDAFRRILLGHSGVIISALAEQYGCGD